MSYEQNLLKMIESNGGKITAFDAAKAGIPHAYLSKLVQENILERPLRGIYFKSTLFDDPMWSLQKRCPKIIFSHETALYLHNLSDRTPLTMSVSVSQNYNASTLREYGCKVYSIIPERFELGQIEMNTLMGNPIRVYDKERSICDIYRSKSRMDIQIVVQAMQRYAKRKDADFTKLYQYAKLLRVEKPITQALEILL
jgi:predicted transcriptional regulator of viral defense system